ncbi:MAG: PQQ-binding-like beta-propeller repeat protein [Actinobacteria bacterium]|nr:PQQ-binding-like beta-propeller repeat protein [Actinomycetota bacterium]
MFLLVLALTAACGRPHHAAVAPARSKPAGWTWQTTADANAGMPAADGGGVASVLNHGEVVLLDARGHRKWEVTPGMNLNDTAPLLEHDAVFVASDDGLVALDRATGATKWATNLGDTGATPARAGHLLVTTTWSKRMAAVDADTGAVAWALDLPGQLYDPPSVVDGLALATWDDGAYAALVAVDVATGALRWSCALPGGGVGAPAIAGDTASVVAGDSMAYAVDVHAGRPRWHAEMPGPGSPEVAPVMLAGGRVALADRDGDLKVVDIAYGREAWAVRGVGVAFRGGPVALGPDTVALPVDDGRVLIAQGGKVADVLDPSGLVPGVATSGDGRLVMATREGEPNVISARAWSA